MVGTCRCRFPHMMPETKSIDETVAQRTVENFLGPLCISVCTHDEPLELDMNTTCSQPQNDAPVGIARHVAIRQVLAVPESEASRRCSVHPSQVHAPLLVLADIVQSRIA